MDINKQAILKKVRDIYLREISMFEENELDNDTYVGKMNGYKVHGDDLSMFALGVQKEFKITISQNDWYSVSSLNDVTNLVIKNLK